MKKSKTRAEDALMTKCVFARVCDCEGKTKTQLTHPHGRLFITHATAQFLSYYKSIVRRLRLEAGTLHNATVSPLNSEQT